MSKRLEGTSKAQIVTPRSITPTNESQNKKKKQENESLTNKKQLVHTKTSQIVKPEQQAQQVQSTSKSANQSKNGILIGFKSSCISIITQFRKI